jgi:hypothetical protein
MPPLPSGCRLHPLVSAALHHRQGTDPLPARPGPVRSCRWRWRTGGRTCW